MHKCNAGSREKNDEVGNRRECEVGSHTYLESDVSQYLECQKCYYGQWSDSGQTKKSSKE